MANFFPRPLMILVMVASGIFTVYGVSISSVAVTNSDVVPNSSTKSLGMINIPQVPEFPKLGARPSKSPSSSGPSPATLPNNQINSQQQQHQQQQQYQPQQQQPQQSSHYTQQTYSQPTQNLIPPFGLPVAFPSIPAPQYESDQQFQYQPEEDHREDYTDDDDSSNVYHETALVAGDTTDHHPNEPVTVAIPSKNESSNNKHASAEVPQQPEKTQQENPEFSMPMHVMTILNALGGGGSLAQATKPEKDGVGQGYTTANAIGYATGDNATVTASVSNKMELNTQTVILTESASASASSMSNGTAFSQATLASNGYTSQFGPEGNGWKAINKNPNYRFK